MANKLKSILSAPGAYLLLAFFLINYICGQFGGNNPNSRLALLRVMSQDQTFQINKVIEQEEHFWTDDWARTPDNRYYTNKAPGAAFFALPVFFIFDKMSELTWKKNKNWHNLPPSRTTRRMTSLISQVIFFILLFSYLYQKDLIAPELKDPKALILFLTLFCFANTAANLMNTFFGHGLSSIFAFWFINSLRIKNYKHLGLSFGLGLLNDYSFAFYLIPALIVIFKDHRPKIKSLIDLVIGGAIPGLIWSWYHWICFGSPLTIAGKFQNPKYIDVVGEDSIGGVFTTKINWDTLFELLFGMKRGLLLTQPWVLLMIVFLAWAIFSKSTRSENKFFLALHFMTFLLFLVMNSSFGGWHGGDMIGPRYMTAILPWFSFSAASLLFYGFFDKAKSVALAVTALWSVMFYSLIYSTKLLSNAPNLLGDLINHFSTENPGKSTLRFLLCLFLVFGAIYLEQKKTDKKFF